LTGDQIHTDHITTGQHVSRHSCRPNVFYFFPHRTFLKTILANRTNGTFGFALTHKPHPSANAKEPFFSQHTAKNDVSYPIYQVCPDNYTTKYNFLSQKSETVNYLSYHYSQVCPDIITMKNKYISTQSNELLFYFNGQNKTCFNYSEAVNAMPDSKGSTLRELLSDMTKRGLLMRLKDGIYYIIPYEANAETFMPDWHLIAENLVNDSKYYIGYYSALQIHNLITQPSLKEQIVVSKQIRPSEIKIKNVPFQFIYHNYKHFFGAKKIWIDSFNKVLCSDLEKTFIDCLFKPNYAGGIVEVARAIYISKDKIKFEILLDYAKKFDSQAVIKRLGFLLEILDINAKIIDDLQKLKTASYVVLDTELPKVGKRNSRWSIQQNLETETIKSAIYT
jgi:predicted transcriptional regulator of viral defense system